MSERHGVCIFGDQTIDWALASKAEDSLRYANERLHVRVGLKWQKGGVFLLASLIDVGLTGLTGEPVEPHYSPPEAQSLSPYESGYNHSYAVFARFKDPQEGEPAPETQKITRVERYMGFWQSRETAPEEREATDEHKSHAPSVIVLDDADLGFRDQFNNPSRLDDFIPKKGSPAPHPWILLKMSDDVANGHLWECMEERLKDSDDWLVSHLIIQTSVARLRDNNAEVSKDLSWERSTYDVLAEIEGCSGLKGLKKCKYLVASFGPTGALLVIREADVQLRLVYDPESMEGDWADKHKRYGMMFGYGSALCASLVTRIVRNKKAAIEENLIEGMKDGLASMQMLYRDGFEVLNDEFHVSRRIFGFDPDETPAGGQLARVNENYTKTRGGFKKVSISVGEILDHSPYPPIMAEPSTNLYSEDNISMRAAREGFKSLENVAPVGQFGSLVTVDKGEIESLRAMRNLVSSYCDKISLDTKPLAVAVFGSPGSGKGYAIKQLLKPWSRDGVIAPIEPFNLSQFSSASEIVGALHQVRDSALSGPIPLAFWDEFDSPLGSVPLGWLRYFLAPMQDGKFQQGDQVHLIGPSVFVFAGGTFERFADFEKRANRVPVESKATDFISRLHGYIDIADINAPNSGPLSGYLMLRRALILNSLFGANRIARTDNGAYDVDDGVLRAFLSVRRYEHGVRSMEAIIKMSRRGNGEPLDRSSLPSEEQLNLHVNGKKFLKKMRSSPTRLFLPIAD
ncbi:hypothetical protein [Streptomyces graminilatus]|uniref:hypothetical protein n=1 Tax=Streptomyces graminilatus TaxID=1464070 RepID=UPI000AE85C88|nr:hypothetical protein [Streptomyces graminilatus]